MTEISYRSRWPCAYFRDNVYFFKIIFIHILGQISSQNLKFFRSTEICYRYRLPFTYFDFNVSFFKIIFIQIFGQIWSRKWTSSNWLKFYTEVDDHVLISILMFIFSNFLFIHIFWGKFGLKIWSFSDWLKFCTEIDYLILISILMFIFSKLFSLIYLLQIWSQNLKFFKLTDIWCRGPWPCPYFHFNVYFFKILFVHIFEQIWPQNLKFFKLTDTWYRGTWPCAYFRFNVYFFKILFIHIFDQICPKVWSFSDWLNFRTEIDYDILISILMFIFSTLFSVIYFGQIWS